MTLARAPGKIVISGAYSVLHGAPALVSAVDRYVTADTARSADFVTAEVRAALGDEPAPWFDASALRRDNRKLGLGSSAAILVASLAARELAARGPLADDELCQAVFTRALIAHREAQRGGSGVDVAASAHGGTLAVRRENAQLAIERVALPSALFIEVWWCQTDASTAAFLGQISALAARDPGEHRARIAAQSAASEAALHACKRADALGLIDALRAQALALGELGLAARIPIVTREVGELAELAQAAGAAFLPAGAGGGDIACYVGVNPASAEFGARATELGLVRLTLALAARGVHAAS